MATRWRPGSCCARSRTCRCFVGYRTKLAQLASFVAVISLHGRVMFIQIGGDVALSELVFWTLFLPLGRRFSVDSLVEELRHVVRGEPRPARPNGVAAFACFALLLAARGRLSFQRLAEERAHVARRLALALRARARSDHHALRLGAAERAHAVDVRVSHPRGAARRSARSRLAPFPRGEAHRALVSPSPRSWASTSGSPRS